MSNTFRDLYISEEILRAITALGYKNPSDVQKKVIPEILKNKDIIVKSETGSGKTAAFGIPICDKVIWEENEPQVLILTPTRELAVQVKEDISNIGRYKRIKTVAVFGKQPFSEQTRELKQKTHVVIGTPGRILDHIDRETINIKNIKYLVLDEADEMLNMGFIDQVEQIIRRVPKERVTLLFSATIPDEIKSLCDKHMNNPVPIEIKAQSNIKDNIGHRLYVLEERDKLEGLKKILTNEIPDTSVIFCRTKDNVDKVFNYLNKLNYSVNRIHGGMLQKERLETMDNFKRGNFRILVATDVIARGIDVEGITHVINYDLPLEKEAYVHRIGRTARAGAKGIAITFTTPFEGKFLKDIEEFIGFSLEKHLLPKDEETQLDKDTIDKLKEKPKVKGVKSKSINKDIMKIYISGGKKKKIRPGDIVGAICNVSGVTSDDIGIIDIQDNVSYVDILNGKGNSVIESLNKLTIKGKNMKVEKAKK